MGLRTASRILIVALLAMLALPGTAAVGPITGVVTANVPNGRLLVAGDTVNVTLEYGGPHAYLMQVYLNVQGMDVGGISPGATRVDPLEVGGRTIGTTVLWDLSGSLSGTVSITCTANPSLAALSDAPTYCGVAGGVNNGDGAGTGDLVRTNGVGWRLAAPAEFGVTVKSTVTPAPAEKGTASPGNTVRYEVTGTATEKLSKITLSSTLPSNVTLLAKTVKPSASIDGRTLVWTFDDATSGTASFDVKIDAADTIPESVETLTSSLHGEALTTAGGTLTADAKDVLRLDDGSLDISLVDANPYFLPDVMLPATDAAKALAARDWVNKYTRVVSRLAADGVSLLLLRTKVDSPRTDSVRFELLADPTGTLSQGGLAEVTDLTLMDRTPDGGTRDTTGDGAPSVTAKVTKEGAKRYAYALLRAPRDFDGTDVSLTASKNTRNVTVRAQGLDKKKKKLRAVADKTVVVARPLLILQHGTFDSPRGWGKFPLWTLCGNEYNNFVIPAGGLPFQVARTSFELSHNSAGPAVPSAFVALTSLDTRIANWAGATDTAIAQVDVVTHSYGGVIMRLIAQGAVSDDPGNPLTVEQHSFRSARNWGHGMIHKLVAIAATHRGSHTGNHLAILNHSGFVRGLIRHFAEGDGSAIDQGAVEDQMVLSPLLRTLEETRLPCHAIVGSGLPEHNQNYEKRFAKVQSADRSGGPYAAAGSLYSYPYTPFESPNFDIFRKVTNYAFDYDYFVLSDDTMQDPNYDLTVSSYSMKGLMPRANYSDHSDLETAAGLVPGALVGRLTHGDEIGIGASGDPTPMNAVALRVIQLLRSPTKSPMFGHFPKASSVPLTALENTMSDRVTFNPEWLKETIPTPFKTARAGPLGPVLSAPSIGQVVVPGQSFDVQIAWPDQALARGFVTWPKGAPDEEPFLDLPPGATRFTVAVSPSRQPGPFKVSAVLLAADGVPNSAVLELGVEDSADYVSVGVRPGGLYLTSIHPTALAVEGQLPTGEWQNILRSSLTTLSSSNLSVASVSSEGEVQPLGIGETTVTATVAGVGSVQIPVVVGGDLVPVTAVPRVKKPVIRLKSKKLAKFAFLSSPTFDATRIDTANLFVAGRKPQKTAVADVNRDRRPDLVMSVRPGDLGLVKGAQTVTLIGVTAGGTIVAGTVQMLAR